MVILRLNYDRYMEGFMDNYHMVVALAGNPNVGKSTIFNGITGLKQHTANWPGVTVESASGEFTLDGKTCILVDLPGTYSLNTHSKEEEVARQYLCSGEADAVVVVCDATCVERGLHLLKQILSLETIKGHGIPLVLCVNLCDEARKKGIEIDFDLLKDVLQIPVISCCARCAGDLTSLKQTIFQCNGTKGCYDCLDFSPKRLAAETVRYTRTNYRKREEAIDRIVTGRFTGTGIMVLLLLGVFWLTMAGANYPSGLLWNLLFSLEGKLASFLTALRAPDLLIQALVYGVAPRGFGAGCLPGAGLGGLCHAAAYGDLFPSVYPA